MQIDMTGRTAIITGASKGIGFAIARRMAAYGAHVVIAARDTGRLQQAAEDIADTRFETGTEASASSSTRPARGAVTAVQCDVATADGVATLYREAVAASANGTIDIIVNNAGVSTAMPSIEVSDEAWQADLDLKLFAAIRLSRLVWPAMQAQRWGRIINVLSTGAKAPAAGSLPSSVARAAGMALTKALSAEGAPCNILVNALLVGRIESDQWARRAAATGRSVQAILQGMTIAIPLGRIGTADEFASVACFLASDLASYVTGTAINVDGGMCPVV